MVRTARYLALKAYLSSEVKVGGRVLAAERENRS